jgi:transcriptional regulator with XRE-family HTH domain
MTQRQVEEATEKQVSNAYLSQPETGKIQQPSPNILHALAELYAMAAVRSQSNPSATYIYVPRWILKSPKLAVASDSRSFVRNAIKAGVHKSDKPTAQLALS